jgi:DNA-directed RNA polymerase specialized sigma24 family protein
MPGVDHFPSTHGTWITVQLDTIADAERDVDAGAPGVAVRREQVAQVRRALREHLMMRYAKALTAYVSGPDFRQLGEPDDLVGGFFARALSQDDFLARWRQSGMPLRRWLMNAMSFHCRGLVRDRMRERSRNAGAPPRGVAPGQAGLHSIAADSEHEATRAFERAWALSLVNEAYARVQASLCAEGREQDDSVLRMHVMEGMTYDQVASALGMTRQECFNAVRRITPRIRSVLHGLLRDDGVPPQDIGAAIDQMIETLGTS